MEAPIHRLVLDRLPKTQSRRASWLLIAWRTGHAFAADRISAVAASVTFYALLAIFPALSAIVSLYGLFADVSAARKDIFELQGLIPAAAISIVGDEMLRLARAPHGSLGAAFAVSLLISIYSANAGMKALLYGLGVAYERPDRRGFLRLNLMSLGLTAAAILVVVIVMAAVVATPEVMALLHVGGGPLFTLLRWPVLVLILTACLYVLFAFGLDGRAEAVAPGAIAGAIGWTAMSLAFSWYVEHFGHFDKTFGSLGAVAGFMTWIWMSVMVVLMGAELNSEWAKAGRPGGSRA
jgi:membrane protein